MGASSECLECDDNSADSAAVYDRKNFFSVVSGYLGPVLSTVMTSSRTSEIIFLDDVIIGYFNGNFGGKYLENGTS